MSNVEKGHNTGLRILEVLKIMLDEDISKKEMIDKIKQNKETGKAYTSEAFIKYFNTLEAAGLQIDREDKAYRLKNALIGADFTDKEKKVFTKLLHSIPKLHDKTKEKAARRFFERLDKYINFDTGLEFNKIDNQEADASGVKNIIKTLEQAFLEEIEAEISYKKKGCIETITAAAKKISERNGRCCILCFNSSMQRYCRIFADSIISVRLSPQKAAVIEPAGTVIYELSGRLAKSYTIKPNEYLEDFTLDCIRIKNTKEDFETLLPRLLKYGENCRILYPENVIKKFLNLTDSILSSNEDNKCQISY